MLDPELDRLLAGLCDDTLDDVEMRILGERIASDPADRQAYVEYLDLHASLLGEAPFAGVTESLGQLEAQVELPAARQSAGTHFRHAGRLAVAIVILFALGGVAWWNWPPAAVKPAAPGDVSWARITDVVGTVELDGSNEPLKSGLDLADDQTVRTGSDDSYAVIELADGSRLLLCPESQLRLTRDELTPAHLRLILSAGVLEADVPELAKNQQLVVVTPQAEIVVRETHCVVSAPDASSTAIETSRGQVSVLRTADGRQADVPAGHFAVAVHDDRDFAVRPVAQLPTQPHAQLGLERARTLTYRGQQILVAASSEQIGTFDRGTSEPTFLGPLDKEAGLHVFSASQSGFIGQVDRSGRVQIFDPQNGSVSMTLETDIRNTHSAVLDETGQLLAMTDRKSGWYYLARIWDLRKPIEQAEIEILGNIRLLSLSPDGRQIALAIERARGFDYDRLEIWNVNPPEMVHRIPVGDRPLRVLTFSHDGAKLAGANDRGRVTIWETRSGLELRDRGPATGWTQPLTSLAFNPTGELLAAGSNNGRVRLWNVNTGEELGVLTCGNRIISALAFSPDGQELAVSAVRGKVLLYRLPVAQNAGGAL